jgi:hypothetical protein
MIRAAGSGIHLRCDPVSPGAIARLISQPAGFYR